MTASSDKYRRDEMMVDGGGREHGRLCGGLMVLEKMSASPLDTLTDVLQQL